MEINQNECVACQMCVGICPTKALQTDPETRKPVLLRPNQCMLCAHCFAMCPKGAIRMFGVEASREAFDEPVEHVVGAIRRRRSVRRFTSQALTRDFIFGLVNITKFCPSGMNQRPVKFIVLARPMLDELASRIAPICEAQFPGIQRLQAKHDAIFRTAQHVIVAYTRRDAIWGQQDAAIAVATIELFCQAKGVGSCWIGFLTRACQQSTQIAHMLGVEDCMIVQSCLGIGVPAIRYSRSVARRDVEIEWRD